MQPFSNEWPNYALERSVIALERARRRRAGRLSRLRRAGCASRGPLNADVRPHLILLSHCQRSSSRAAGHFILNATLKEKSR